VSRLRSIEFGDGSQINVPIAVLIWLMIYPMMLKIDFTSLPIVRPPVAMDSCMAAPDS
jgi:ACR3 family arsenite efflux pump ArsB